MSAGAVAAAPITGLLWERRLWERRLWERPLAANPGNGTGSRPFAARGRSYRGGWSRGGLVLLLALLLTGCGWHLRGMGPGASLEGEVIYLANDGVGGQIADMLRQSLLRGGAELAETPAAADAVLVLLNDSHERRTLSVDRNVQVREYEVLYQLTYAVEGPDGEPWLPPQQVSNARAYEFDPNDVLSSRSREDEVLEELKLDTTRLVLTRLQALLETGPVAVEPEE